MDRQDTFAVAAWRALRGMSPTLLLALGAAAFAAMQLSKVSDTWAIVLFAVGVLASLTGVIWAAFSELAKLKSLAEARDEARAAEARADAFVPHVEPRNPHAKAILVAVLDELGILAPEHRASVWMKHDRDDDGYYLAARYSSNAWLCDPGRAQHAAGTGVVHAAWTKKRFHRDDLPARRDTWDRRMSEQYGIPLATVKQLRMHSRSYACLRIDYRAHAVETPLAVLILESEEQYGIDAELPDLLLSSQLWVLLESECHRMAIAQSVISTSV